MAFNGVFIKLLTIAWPLIKEYVTTNNKGKDILSLRTMTAWVLIVLLTCTATTMYSAEQASNNLKIHEPIIKQYNSVKQENAKLKQQLVETQTKLFDCEKRVTTTMSECSATQANLSSLAEYVYDPKTNTMVLRSDLKK